MSQEQQRHQLVKLQTELEERVSAIRRDLSGGHSRDSEEQAQERENDDVLNGLLAEAQDQLNRISAALRKIDEGTYGQCEQCGDSIDPRRLESLPDASLCIKCAA
ncbi:MAG: TraR/DksA family transcriptional regulator [Pseudohongiellaceae bacterium]